MPDSVKISELATRAAASDDSVPAVDSTFSQTVRVSASSIAAIGGGPPGDNMVSTAKLQNSAVTLAKLQNIATDTLLGRSSAGSGAVQEVACTAFGRQWIASATALAASEQLTLNLFSSPSFTGNVSTTGNVSATGTVTAGQPFRGADGTADAPGFSFTGDTNTGIARLGGANTLSIVTDGVERFRVGSTGAISSTVLSGSTLYPHFGVRAYAHWVGGAFNGGNISSITFVQTGVYSILFATPMPDAHYAIVTSGPTDMGPVDVLWTWLPAPATQAQGFRLILAAPNASNLAATGFMFAVVR